ncbi:MAG TPA: type 4a pilus biogenesis protein PilO [Candidatus Hydrogenedentes bacterium]|jgi:type IV pilus assembly protein PilO|nr:type 4a pilus biogenesis protein PilO [Candidatus Hydrogenedentota bacterium]MDY0030641.1 type 4a pilus biogenesis protein PilO [FCB group bacterium]NLT61976.1 type 4a pilus biogenesis protein PilO [Candidatus Hydrogenedentota bacterium]HNZ20209.1 type 4a pilus biogenesis protein PilO [Candidatus Hydrogenedentota bacterium]HOH35616.1 type 4a pilus biogenesis protein PilO [Candidatus Hydrogenedentota bacterium]
MIGFLKGTVTPKDWMFVGVILGLTALLCAVFYFLVYQPELQRLDQTRKELADAQTELANRKQLAANIDALRADTAQIRELVSDFEERLPSEREIATLLTQFEDIAGDVGGLDVQMRAQIARPEGAKLTIPYRIVVRGSFHDIAEFINRLERFKRYLKVSELQVGPEKDGVSEAEFTLSTYTFVENDTEGAA